MAAGTSELKIKPISFPEEVAQDDLKLFGQNGPKENYGDQRGDDGHEQGEKVVRKPKRDKNALPRQPKYIVTKVSASKLDNDLSRIIACVNKGQRSNIDDYTKGHLNERHLYPRNPPQLGDKDPKWKNSTETPKPRQTNQAASKPINPKKTNYSNMNFALQEFVLRTGGGVTNKLSEVYDDLHATKQAFENNNELGNQSKRSDDNLGLPSLESPTKLTSRSTGYDRINANKQSTAFVEDLRNNELKLPVIPPIKKASEKKEGDTDPRVDPFTKYNFHVSHLYGATKKDQMEAMLGFQNKVMRLGDAKEVKVVSQNLTLKGYKEKLGKLISSVPRKLRKENENSWKLQIVLAHGVIWEDLIKDSPIFGPVLSVIKKFYDDYLQKLTDLSKKKQDKSFVQNEVVEMLLGSSSSGGLGKLTSSSDKLARDQFPNNRLFDEEFILEENDYNNQLEEEYCTLLEENKRLNEEVKAQKIVKFEQRALDKEAQQKLAEEKNKEDKTERLEKLMAEIQDVANEVEFHREYIAEQMVPACLTENLQQIISQDEQDCRNIEEICDVIMTSSADVGNELNQNLQKAVISGSEISLLWRKLRSMTLASQYCLANRNDFSSARNAASSIARTKVDEAINITEKDIATVIAANEEESANNNETSRREDFDFYF